MKNITHSKTRTVALGKYLTATCRSLVKEPEGGTSRVEWEDEPPSRRRQLHILYLLNDLLHHVEFHAESPTAKITLVESLPSSLLEIFQFSSALSLKAFPKHHVRILDLLDLWAKHDFYPSTYIQKLRDTAVNAAKAQDDVETIQKPVNGIQDDFGQLQRGVPYIMPPSHGDPSIPFYDLPAGNMMPLIIPNSTAPINPQSMKALQFVTGPADPQLANTVENFLKSVDALDLSCIPESEEDRYDIDELGQYAIAGEVLEGEGYYGWSRAFCEKMKNGGDIRGFGNDITRDQSSSRSRSPRKRRRYSSSRSYSSGDGGRSVSRSRSASVERQRFRNVSASRSRSPPFDPRFQSNRSTYGQPPPPPPLQSQGNSPPPPPPFTQGFPLGPGGVPIPPKPAGYTGPWPPPPPPPSSPGGVPVPPKPAGYSGPWPPPPPPPQGASQGMLPFPFGPANQGFLSQGEWSQQRVADRGFVGQPNLDPITGHTHPYGMPPQGQSQIQSHDNVHQNALRRGYGRGGRAR